MAQSVLHTWDVGRNACREVFACRGVFAWGVFKRGASCGIEKWTCAHMCSNVVPWRNGSTQSHAGTHINSTRGV